MMNFENLHQQASPLLICNVWDVVSAKAAKELNFEAIGTSSGAIATMLGYQDGEEMSFEELAYIVKRIRKCVDLPLTVDLEAGYSRQPAKIVEHIAQLADLGVVGINLEDSVVVEGKRKIVAADQFAALLETVCVRLQKQNIDLFINVRTDAFLLGLPNPVSNTISRAKKYETAGANGLFTPCIEKVTDIEAVLETTNLPLNVMCMPNLPKFEVLQQIGVHRISMGGFAFRKINNFTKITFQQLLQDQSFKHLFE
ncbi:MAG: isocitrate lyase/PEP mutase family protein [Chitinophagales bacterium]